MTSNKKINMNIDIKLNTDSNNTDFNTDFNTDLNSDIISDQISDRNSDMNNNLNTDININKEMNKNKDISQKKNINKIIENFNLETKWTLWFHKVNDNNWDLDRYFKVFEIVSYYDLLFIMNKLDNIISGMFFLMKDGIIPIYEDENNKNGGYWSLRISKKDSFEYWQKIVYYLCMDNITLNEEYKKKINGVSISPKVNNCIFKIWNNNFKEIKTENMRKDLDFINWNDTYYLEHSE